MEKRFLLSSDCKIVNGDNGILLYDLGRQRYISLTTEMHHVILAFSNKQSLEHSDKEELEFIDFLVKEEYGFYVPASLIDCFPSIGSDAAQPNHIHSTTIEFDNILNIQKALDYIFTETHCRNYLLIIDRIDKLEINNLKVLLSVSFNPTIDLIILDGGDISYPALEAFIQYTPNIKSIQAYKCRIPSLNIINNCTISLSEKTYAKETKVNVSTDNFFVNTHFFNEAQKYNPAFYKTIYINKDLSIKRYADDHLSFGQLFSTDLKSLKNSKSFIELWSVHKSMISQCLDCKYRYMCLDPRIPIKVSNKWQYGEECLQFHR